MGLTAERLDELGLFGPSHLVDQNEWFAVLAAARTSLWRPISEAPKERTVLLAMEMRDGTPILPDNSLAADIGWLEDGEWYLASNDNGPSAFRRPTHWMPLPEPPE